MEWHGQQEHSEYGTIYHCNYVFAYLYITEIAKAACFLGLVLSLCAACGGAKEKEAGSIPEKETDGVMEKEIWTKRVFFG